MIPFDPEGMQNPEPGYYALDLNAYLNNLKTGFFKDRKPDEKIGKTYFVFRVPEN